MRWKIPRTRTTRRALRTRSALATCCTRGQRIPTTRPLTRAGAKWANKKLKTRASYLPKAHGDRRREILAHALKFVDGAKAAGKPFFLWLNPTRMHVVTHLSDKYEKMRTSENGWSLQEAGMAQLDDIVGGVMKHLKDQGLDENTIVVFSTDNGCENFTWPDGGQTPFAGGKGTVLEGGFRVPCIARWPGKIPAGKVENGIMSGLDWFPSSLSAAGNANIAGDLNKGKKLGDTTYKVHLDGYDQTPFSPGRGRQTGTRSSTSPRARLERSRQRLQVPVHRPARRLARRDRQARLAVHLQLASGPVRANRSSGGSTTFYNWFAYQFWRFVLVGKRSSAVTRRRSWTFRPCRGGSFNMEAVKTQIREAIKSRTGQ